MFADTFPSSFAPVATLSGKVQTGLSAQPELLCLNVSDHLYREGDLRTHAYKLEHGAVAVYEKRVGRSNHTIKIAGRGDFVGLGCFERYGDGALALERTLMSCFDEQELMALAERDPTLRTQRIDAIRADFVRRKATILDRYPSTSAEAVAAFLVSVSRQNLHEGRVDIIIADSLKCGAVANLLGFDIDTLGKALVELENKGLIQAESNGQIRLLDLDQLESLADGSFT